MGTIPDFQLPSNPSITVRMREATVADAIDFSGVAEHMEENATSLFLERIQGDKAKYSDPKKWTGEDRRFALLWYWLHVEKDHDVPLIFDCSLCGKKHTELIDFRELSNGYLPINGKPERDFEYGGKKITVHPLCGSDLEELELLRLSVRSIEAEYGADSGKFRQGKTRLAVMELILSFRLSGEPQEKPREFREKYIEGMTMAEFETFSSMVADSVLDMRHGLECEISDGKTFLISPPVSCPDHPLEVGPRLRIPFWTGDYIPSIL